MKQTQASGPVVLLALLLGAALGGGITWVGAAAVSHELALRGGSAVVEAKVLDSRIMSSRTAGKSYEVLYEFTLPEDPTRFTHGDETGRTELWASVDDEEIWRRAVESGQLEVSYLPGQPDINRPLQAGAAPLGDPIAGMVVGLLLLVPCLLVFVVHVRRRFSRNPATVRG